MNCLLFINHHVSLDEPTNNSKSVASQQPARLDVTENFKTKGKGIATIPRKNLNTILKIMKSLSMQVKATDKFGCLPLHWTCQLGTNLTLIQSLVEQYPELLHVRYNLGDTQCDILACCKWVNQEVQAFLLNLKNCPWHHLSLQFMVQIKLPKHDSFN
jgi:hypothetical protein